MSDNSAANESNNGVQSVVRHSDVWVLRQSKWKLRKLFDANHDIKEFDLLLQRYFTWEQLLESYF